MLRSFRLAILGVVVAATLGIPNTSGAQTATRDSVVGTGITGRPGITPAFTIATFNVFSGPSGEDPGGTVVGFESIRQLTSTSKVLCLAVTGNRAVMGTRLTTPSPFGTGERYFLVYDGGPTGQDTFDVHRSDGPPTNCSSEGDELHRPFDSSDIVVTDAQPFPTSKDQCKNGGWRNYGTTFKNQGQCVAFVQRGPKP